MSAHREHLKVAVVGHVDHGKSTLVGRLLHDTGSLPDGKLEAIQEVCRRRGVSFEWAFLMDALQAERDQGVTIDTSQIWFHTAKRNYVIIDAPGHKEFLKNMVTGAAASDAALLIIDAEEGVREQSRRHGYLLHLLGVRQVAVAVNKMDLVGYSRDRFAAIADEYRAYLAGIGVTPTFVIPVSARDGANVVAERGGATWWDGPTVLEALEQFKIVTEPEGLPLRMPIQDVYRFDKRVFAGRIESGVLRVGDRIVFSPSNRTSTIRSIEAWHSDPPPTEAHAGQSIGFTLDDQVFAERGEVVSHEQDAPVETDVFRARLFWLGARPLTRDTRLRIKLNSAEAEVRVQEIERVIDTGDLSTAGSDRVERNAVAEVVLQADRMLALDEFSTAPATGRFVLVDGYDISGGGIVSMEGYADQRQLTTVRASNIQWVEHAISTEARARRNGHGGGVLWLTGLSGAGKSTLAVATERRLFNLGFQVYVLDGDNVRHGLNADLGFSPEERAENIRRVGEVGALMANAGILVITAFISPYRSDRERARKAAGAGFHEVFVKADLAVCESRDPKGLYAKARSGAIKEFTGVSAPYEAPESPELVVDTAALEVDACVDAIVEYVREQFRVAPVRAAGG
ncbi:MAG: adenylyl-sulfate kinase [Proteobacteria bacterium]|nr:adenylyl-sulfate kinase [Pseudomonadota bacterium]MDA1131679.1 adenylyl-sulfate kinase [Pseudomonadota bacterium]